MKIVGLKIEKGKVAASVVLKTFRQVELKDSFSLPFTTDAELVDILKERSKDWGGARIVSSVPGHYFSQRTIPFPFADRNRVEKALPFEIEDSVPFPLDDVVLDHVILEGAGGGTGAGVPKETPVLGLMLPKEILRRHLELLASASGPDSYVELPFEWPESPAQARLAWQEVVESAQQISTAAQEQTSGARQVAGSISSIDHMVRATVEQGATMVLYEFITSSKRRM